MFNKVKFKKLASVLMLLFCFSIQMFSQNLLDYLPLIPKPKQAELKGGDFSITSETPIFVSGNGAKEDAELLNDYLDQNYGFRLKISSSKQNKTAAINIHKEEATSSSQPDAYELVVK